MGLETATFIDGLVTSNPIGNVDPKSQGDDHLRLIKSVLKNTLPGAIGPLEFQLQDDGAAIGPNLTLDRLSTTPAQNDLLGGVTFRGRDDGGNIQDYARVVADIENAANSSELGRIKFQVAVNGVLTEVAAVNSAGFDLSAGAVISGTVYSNYNGGDIASVVGVTTTSGGLIEAPDLQNLVIGIRENSSDDTFSIISGGGNYSSDETYDTLIAQFRADGAVRFPSGTVTAESSFISNTGNSAVEGALEVSGGNFMNLDFLDDLTGQTATVRIGRGTTASVLNVDIMPPNGSGTAALRLSSTGAITFPGGGGATYSSSGVTTDAGSTLFSTLQTGAGGTAAAPSHTWASENNKGMYSKSAGVIGFSTGGTERVTISSSGISGGGSGLTSLNASNISSGTLAVARLHSSVWRDGNQPASIDLSASSDALSAGGGTRPTHGLVRLTATATNEAIAVRSSSDVDGRNAMVFETLDGSDRGAIVINAGGVNYSSSSDYRLPWKEGAEDLQNSGEFIDALKPKYFPKAGQAGFFAHEFAEVSPSSVEGEKDAVDEEGKPIYQSMQASSADVMAHLVAEVQSIRRRVETLEAN